MCCCVDFYASGGTGFRVWGKGGASLGSWTFPSFGIGYAQSNFCQGSHNLVQDSKTAIIRVSIGVYFRGAHRMKLAAPRTSVTAHPGDGIKTLWPRRSSRRVGIRRLGLKPFLILFLIFVIIITI